MIRRAALGAAIFLALAIPAQADQTIAQLRAPTKVSENLDQLVWSDYDPATNQFFLTLSQNGGPPQRLPVAPREVPFDVDVGDLGGGAPAAVYSRCRTEPDYRFGANHGSLPNWSRGRGCDLYMVNLHLGRVGGEVKIVGASSPDSSEFMPTISLGRIAFARIADRGRTSDTTARVYWRQRHGGGASHRLHAGPAAGGGAGPTSLDMLGRTLAFSWEWVEGTTNFSRIQVQTVTGGLNRVLESGAEGESAQGRTLMSVSMLSPRRLAFGRDVRTDVNQTESLVTSTFRQTVRKSAASLPTTLISVVDAGDPVYVRAPQLVVAGPDRPMACVDPSYPPACELIRVTG